MSGKQTVADSVDLSSRNRDVFQTLVEMYLQNGHPVGSRPLSRELDIKLSSATIRNAMQDLEYLGLLTLSLIHI